MLNLVLISSLVGLYHNLELPIHNIVGTLVRLSEELFILYFFPPHHLRYWRNLLCNAECTLLYDKGRR